MPSPVEEPSFRSQGTDLPQGSSSQLDEGLDLAANAPGFASFSSSAIDESEIPEFTGEVDADEFDEVIFGEGTMFPGRPITHGVPMGPGADFVIKPRMSDRAILTEAARRILELRSDIPVGASNFAGRVLAGD